VTETWIKAYRRLLQHDIWLGERFTKGQAWMDMLLIANHDTGTLHKPQRYWAKRWGWSRSKVKHFFEYLREDGMIETVEHGGLIPGRPHGLTTSPTTIRICNYKQYQHMPTTSPTTGLDHLLQEEKNNIQESYLLLPKGSKLPSSEEIHESSDKKLTSDLTKICQQLTQEKIFPKAFAFKNKMLKQGNNKRAILHALCRCYMKQEFDERGAWGYCLQILKIENGNFNERDYHKGS